MNKKTVQKDTNELTEQEIREIAEENRDRRHSDTTRFQERISKDGSISTMM